MAKKNGRSTSITTGSGSEPGGSAITSPIDDGRRRGRLRPRLVDGDVRLVDGGGHPQRDLGGDVREVGAVVVERERQARAPQRVDEVERLAPKSHFGSASSTSVSVRMSRTASRLPAAARLGLEGGELTCRGHDDDQLEAVGVGQHDHLRAVDFAVAGVDALVHHLGGRRSCRRRG